MNIIQSSGFVVEQTIYSTVYRFGIQSAKHYCFLKKENLRKVAVNVIRAIKEGKEIDLLVTKEVLRIDVGKKYTTIFFIDGPSRYFYNDTIYLVMKNVLRLVNGTN